MTQNINDLMICRNKILSVQNIAHFLISSNCLIVGELVD